MKSDGRPASFFHVDLIVKQWIEEVDDQEAVPREAYHEHNS